MSDEAKQIARGLTDAQAWALVGVTNGHGHYPADLGQWMVNRPDAKVCEYKKKKGWHKAQGLAFIGGPMLNRLEKKGLLNIQFGAHSRSSKLTPLGLAVRRELERMYDATD